MSADQVKRFYAGSRASRADTGKSGWAGVAANDVSLNAWCVIMYAGVALIASVEVGRLLRWWVPDLSPERA